MSNPYVDNWLEGGGDSSITLPPAPAYTPEVITEADIKIYQEMNSYMQQGYSQKDAYRMTCEDLNIPVDPVRLSNYSEL